MFKRLKQDYQNFINAREQIILLKDRVKFLQKVNKSLYKTVNVMTTDYCNNILEDKNLSNN